MKSSCESSVGALIAAAIGVGGCGICFWYIEGPSAVPTIALLLAVGMLAFAWKLSRLKS
jgi:hypothetical protein